MKKSILITGGCGFVGSSLSISLKIKYPNYQILALDNLKRRGSELNIPRLKNLGIDFIHGDLRNPSDLIFDRPIDVVIDAAAEPSVLAGINGGLDYLVNTNLNGTVNTLNATIKHKAKFIFLSTSRVYPISLLKGINYIEEEDRLTIIEKQDTHGVSSFGISEEFPLNGPRSFYGTTKLASELLLQEYGEFHNLDFVINRFGVIAGPYQMGKVDQGVIALWMFKHFWKQELSYIGFDGTGKQVRDILHIQDVVELIDYQIHNFSTSNRKVFNAGGGLENSVSLKELSRICAEITGNKIEIQSIKETRKGDIPSYITDNSYINKEISWKPKRSVENTLTDVFDWIKSNENELKKIVS